MAMSSSWMARERFPTHQHITGGLEMLWDTLKIVLVPVCIILNEQEPGSSIKFRNDDQLSIVSGNLYHH